jgi:hypothetical protein
VKGYIRADIYVLQRSKPRGRRVLGVDREFSTTGVYTGGTDW